MALNRKAHGVLDALVVQYEATSRTVRVLHFLNAVQITCLPLSSTPSTFSPWNVTNWYVVHISLQPEYRHNTVLDKRELLGYKSTQVHIQQTSKHIHRDVHQSQPHMLTKLNVNSTSTLHRCCIFRPSRPSGSFDR
jgi:hypothetical protein